MCNEKNIQETYCRKPTREKHTVIIKRTILLKLTFSFLFVGSRLLFEDTRREDIASKRYL